jgi:hypothetical protein
MWRKLDGEKKIKVAQGDLNVSEGWEGDVEGRTRHTQKNRS